MRLRLQGVARQKLKLSDKTILEHMPANAATPASQADMLAMQKTFLARLDALEKRRAEPPPSTPLAAMAQGAVASAAMQAELSKDLQELRHLLPVLEERVKRDRESGIATKRSRKM